MGDAARVPEARGQADVLVGVELVAEQVDPVVAPKGAQVGVGPELEQDEGEARGEEERVRYYESELEGLEKEKRKKEGKRDRKK